VSVTILRRLFVATLFSALSLGAMPGRAAEPKPADSHAPVPDAEFLEFLGGNDDVDPDLQQYLASPQAAPNDDRPAPRRGSGRT
jgi:hypothetical protein